MNDPRRASREEIDEELRFHVAERAALLREQGMSPDDAMREATKRFGDPVAVRAACQDANGPRRRKRDPRRPLGIALDLAFGLRALRRNPGFAFVAILTLGLGIGVNTAMFSIVNAVLLRPLPYPDPAELVTLRYANPERGRTDAPISKPNFVDLRASAETLDGMAAFPIFTFTGVVVTGDGEPEELDTGYVSGDFFGTLGAPLEFGRGIAPDEDVAGNDAVVVLSDRVWRQRYGADPGVVGTTVTLDGEPFTVVGIASSALRLPDTRTDVWVPLSRITPDRIPHHERGIFWLVVVGRMKESVGVADVQAEFNTLAQRLETAYPDANEGWTGVTITPLHEELVGDTRSGLLILLGAVGLVLLIACVNVANLLLARATARTHEMAIRTALGAGRARLARQLLTESLLLAGAGGLAGLAIAAAASKLFLGIATEQLPRYTEVNMDPRVLAFSLGISLLTGLLFGSVPAMRASRLDIQRTLRASGRSSTPAASRNLLRHMLVVTEIGLAVMLVLGAGVLMKSFWTLRDVDPGFDMSNVVTVTMNFPGYRFPETALYQQQYEAILEAIRATPGVVAAGGVHQMPGVGLNESTGFDIPGREPPQGRDSFSALMRTVSPGYFDTMRIPTLQGRTIERQDAPDRPYALVINRTMADEMWPGENPIGQSIGIWRGTGEIVGVVGDVKHAGLASTPRPTIYVSNAQVSRSRVVLMVRADRDLAVVAGAVREAIWSVDPNQPIRRITAMEEILGETVAGPRFAATLLGGFAVLALVMAALGIYGVIAYFVSQRTGEFGIRLTLGARRRDVMRLVLGQGLVVTVIGVALGVAGSLALSRVFGSMLFEVRPTDPAVLLVVTAAAFTTAGLACYIPARRATRVDPLAALRAQ